MAALAITLTSAAAFSLQHVCLGLAERVEAGVARDKNLFVIRQARAGAGRSDALDQIPISGFGCDRLMWIESSVLKELTRRPDYYKAVVSIGRRRLAAAVPRLSSYRAAVILPNQFVRVRKTILLKNERTVISERTRTRAGAPTQDQGHQNEEPAQVQAGSLGS